LTDYSLWYAREHSLSASGDGQIVVHFAIPLVGCDIDIYSFFRSARQNVNILIGMSDRKSRGKSGGLFFKKNKFWWLGMKGENSL
jgi:hypothetical protein